ncbi:ATP-dependent DNA helicase PIF1 [Folsomia candida]|uniref:ATP-dependent DNA helicase n=1 Tax=Folsomia candida TaxID=158441 RepID=A0A226CY81_FOLCA|nr:ATP-dependent DNA helicase PIF1 [Folsomia candida]
MAFNIPYHILCNAVGGDLRGENYCEAKSVYGIKLGEENTFHARKFLKEVISFCIEEFLQRKTHQEILTSFSLSDNHNVHAKHGTSLYGDVALRLNLPNIDVVRFSLSRWTKKKNIPPQAFFNGMKQETIPEVIKCLSPPEFQLISQVRPFMKIFYLSKGRGQQAIKGSAINFPNSLKEICQELPLPNSSTEFVVVHEKIEGIQNQHDFRVRPSAVLKALQWLKQNNWLYRNVAICERDESAIQPVIIEASVTQAMVPHKNIPVTMLTYSNLGQNRRILRASCNQASHGRFNEAGRGKQCTAMSMTSLAYSCIQNPSTWTTDTLDDILLRGDKLYHEKATRGEFLTAFEAQGQIDNIFGALTVAVAIDESDARSLNGQLNRLARQLSSQVLRLDAALRNFIESEYTTAILTVGSYSMAIMKYVGNVYLFDSHSRGPHGRVAVNGLACIIEFEISFAAAEISKLVHRNLEPKHDPKSQNTANYLFNITPVITVTEYRREEEEAVVSTSHNSRHSNPAPATSQDTGDRFSDLLHEAQAFGENVMVDSLLHNVDFSVPDIGEIVTSSKAQNTPSLLIEKEKGRPLYPNHEAFLEELSFVNLFPFGRGGASSVRPVQITPLDYFQARVMSNDTRFWDNSFLFYALNRMEEHKVKQKIAVCGQMRTSSNGVQNYDEYPGLTNVHLYMSAIRGGASYWKSYKGYLIAMIAQRGIPNIFLTVSSDDLNSTDSICGLLLADAMRGNCNADLITQIRQNLESRNYAELEKIVNTLSYEQKSDLLNRHPLVTDANAIAFYIAKYISKAEPTDIQDEIQIIMQQLQSNSKASYYQMATSIAMKIMNKRQVSAPEAAYRLCHLKLRHSSRGFVFIPAYLPNKRLHLIQKESIGNANVKIGLSIIDKYCLRPTNLADICLLEFAAKYIAAKRDETEADLQEGNEEEEEEFEGHTIRLNNGTVMKIRKRPAIVKYPNFDALSQSEDYYYCMMLLYYPFIDENAITSGFQTIIDAFKERSGQFRNSTHADFLRPTLAHEIDRALIRIQNFEEPMTPLIDGENYVPYEFEDEDNNGPENEIFQPINDVGNLQERFHTLSEEQKEVFLKVKLYLDGADLGKMIAAISGSGGTGKSYLIDTLASLISSYCLNGHNLLKAAPTGMSALNINATTIHRAFKLPVQRGFIPAYVPLKSKQVEELRVNLRQLKWIIIDEPPSTYLHEVNLWKLFSFYELFTNHRQTGDTRYLQLLERLRFGQCTQEDLGLLQARIFDLEDSELFAKFSDALALFPTNTDVNKFNEKQTEKLKDQLSKVNKKTYIMRSKDTYAAGVHYDEPCPENLIPKEERLTAGIPITIEIDVGSRIMLRRNWSLSDGLVNGSVGTVVGIKWTALRDEPLQPGDLPQFLIVRFDGGMGGRKKDINGYVPVECSTFEFPGKRQTLIKRRAFTVILCWALVFHKTQGLTLHFASIDLSKRQFAKAMGYVALSRLKSSSGLRIIGVNETNILTLKKNAAPCDEDALRELYRLRLMKIQVDENEIHDLLNWVCEYPICERSTMSSQSQASTVCYDEEEELVKEQVGLIRKLYEANKRTRILEVENGTLRSKLWVLESSVEQAAFLDVCNKLKDAEEEIARLRGEKEELGKITDARQTKLFHRILAEKVSRKYFANDAKNEYAQKKKVNLQLSRQERMAKVWEQRARLKNTELRQVKKINARNEENLLTEPINVETVQFHVHEKSAHNLDQSNIEQRLCACGKQMEETGTKVAKRKERRRKAKFYSKCEDDRKSFCRICL